MDFVFDVAVAAEGDDAVDEVGCNILLKSILEGLFEIPRAWQGGHRGENGMCLTQCTGQILGGKKLEVLVHFEHLGLRVEIIWRRHLQRAGCNA